MKYYLYQHVYNDKNKKTDIQVLTEHELAKAGFQQQEVEERGGSFTIEYKTCTLIVRECKGEYEAIQMLVTVINENPSITVYKSWQEYKDSVSC